MAMTGFRIATIRGIPIRIHISFLLVLPFLAFAFARTFRAAADFAGVPARALTGSPWLWGLAMAVALFFSVLLHELAHSLYALRRGGRVRDITLLMIGGVSQISELPKEPKHEAMMALVGPLLSIGLGVASYALSFVVGDGASFNLTFALFYLGTLNVVLGVFNLLPAFPMDGGRVLRAVLAPRLGLIRATNVAATVGKVFAVLFAIVGLFGFNFVLLLIAFFVYLGAEAESRGVLMRALLGRLHVADVMIRQVAWVPADLSIHDTAERMLRERRVAFTVAAEGRPIGQVTLDAIQKVPAERRAGLTTREVTVETPAVATTDDIASALRTMDEQGVSQLAVIENAALVGTLTRDDIGRALKLSELEATQHPGPRWPTGPREIPT